MRRGGPVFMLNISGADCKNDKTSKVSIELVDNSPYHLIGAFDGPEGTPYEGGHYQVVRRNISTFRTRHSHTMS